MHDRDGMTGCVVVAGDLPVGGSAVAAGGLLPPGVAVAETAAGWLCRRGLRVLMLVATIVVLSVADLYMTLLHATTVGMAEDNPLARMMLRHSDPVVLSVWKLGTVALVGYILLMARRRGIAEVGAWICVLMLAFVMARWIQYGDLAHELTPLMGSSFAFDDPKWVVMAVDGR